MPDIPSCAALVPSASARAAAHGAAQGAPGDVEISVVLPCLNEEAAIGGCIDTIQQIIAARHLSAEILVVDNASTDRSAEIARERGARVVCQPVRGYGNAYMKGFAAARGRYIFMADADGTYDFNEIEAFIAPLRRGYDLVMGNRFGGRMARSAMPWANRYIGNPLLSGLLNLVFHTGVHDVHCGMRACTREAAERMRPRSGGMEFASEMVINAARADLKIAQRPIAYHPRVGESKLRPVRDGWRHLRFMLLHIPMPVTLIPAALVVLLGLALGGVLAQGSLPLFGRNGNVQALILPCLLVLMGFAILAVGVCARFWSRRQRPTTKAEKLHLGARAHVNRADAGLPATAPRRGEGVQDGHSNG